LEQVRERLGEDFYILPSSIHELLVLPRSMMDANELQEMVKCVNATVVNPEDVLSDGVYAYTNGTLCQVAGQAIVTQKEEPLI
jgi:hypothetical protein